MLTDDRLRSALFNTVVLTAGAVIFSMILGLLLAILLDRKFFGRGVVRTLLITPFLIMPVAAALLWKHGIFNPDYGLINGIFGGHTAWATQFPKSAIITTLVWQWTPFMMLILLAGLQSMPGDQVEAARVDGAGSWRIFRTVILPLTRPAVAAVAIFTFVFTWNNLLWPLLVLTNPDLMTIPVGLATVQGSFGIRYADTMASAILGALPLIAVFLLFQRHIVEGIAGTGLKG